MIKKTVFFLGFLLIIILIFFLLNLITKLIRMIVRPLSKKKINLEKYKLPDSINKTQQHICSANCTVFVGWFSWTYPLTVIYIYKDFILIHFHIISFADIVLLKDDIDFIEYYNCLKIYHNAKNISNKLVVCPYIDDIPKIVETLRSLEVTVKQ